MTLDARKMAQSGRSNRQVVPAAATLLHRAAALLQVTGPILQSGFEALRQRVPAAARQEKEAEEKEAEEESWL